MVSRKPLSDFEGLCLSVGGIAIIWTSYCSCDRVTVKVYLNEGPNETEHSAEGIRFREAAS